MPSRSFQLPSARVRGSGAPSFPFRRPRHGPWGCSRRPRPQHQTPDVLRTLGPPKCQGFPDSQAPGANPSKLQDPRCTRPQAPRPPRPSISGPTPASPPPSSPPPPLPSPCPQLECLVLPHFHISSYSKRAQCWTLSTSPRVWGVGDGPPTPRPSGTLLVPLALKA